MSGCVTVAQQVWATPMVTRQGVVDASTGKRCNVDADRIAASALVRDCTDVYWLSSYWIWFCRQSNHWEQVLQEDTYDRCEVPGCRVKHTIVETAGRVIFLSFLLKTCRHSAQAAISGLLLSGAMSYSVENGESEHGTLAYLLLETLLSHPIFFTVLSSLSCKFPLR